MARFLIAVGERDYERACEQMLVRRGCREMLEREDARLTTFGLLGSMAFLDRAIVLAAADGVQSRVSLVRRHGRRLIEELEEPDL